MSTLLSIVGLGLVLELLPSLGLAQSTDRSEMDQWLKITRVQDIPIGTMGSLPAGKAEQRSRV